MLADKKMPAAVKETVLKKFKSKLLAVEMFLKKQLKGYLNYFNDFAQPKITEEKEELTVKYNCL